MAPGEQTVEIDAELRNLVEQAFPETIVDVVAETDDSSPAYRSDNARDAWVKMHGAAKGREIDVLLEMLDGTWLTGEERWKAVTFLGYSLASPEGKPRHEEILKTLAVEAIVKQRGSGLGDAVRVQGAAVAAVADAPLAKETKWQFMLDAVQASRSYFRDTLDALARFHPFSTSAAAANAQPILLDAMVRSDRVLDLDAVARVVRELDVRSGAADLRRLILAANSNLSSRVASILADWGDAPAAFEIRRAINQYSTASDPNVDTLVDALYRIDGAASVEFIAEVFRAAPPALQEHLILHSLRTIPSAVIAKAIRQTAETTSDVELKEAANAYLDDAPAVDEAEEAAAIAAASEAVSSAAAATQDSAEGWAPKLDDKPVQMAGSAPDAAVVAAATAAVAAATAPSAAAAAAAAGWQPSDDAMPVADGEDRARRLGVEAEALALIRAEAAREAAERAASEQAKEPPGPIEILVRLPQILFALAVLAALLALVFSSE